MTLTAAKIFLSAMSELDEEFDNDTPTHIVIQLLDEIDPDCRFVLDPDSDRFAIIFCDGSKALVGPTITHH